MTENELKSLEDIVIRYRALNQELLKKLAVKDEIIGDLYDVITDLRLRLEKLEKEPAGS